MADKTEKQVQQPMSMRTDSVRAESRFDKRILDRNIAKGTVSPAEVEARIKGLADLTEKSDNIATLVFGEPR